MRRVVLIAFNVIGLGQGSMILHRGTEEQKSKYLKNILSAEDIWLGLRAGSRLRPRQRADARREGRQRVRHQRHQDLDHGMGNYAEALAILLARTNLILSGMADGLSFFLSPMDVPGIDPRPIQKLTGEYGFTETFFTDARTRDLPRRGG